MDNSTMVYTGTASGVVFEVHQASGFTGGSEIAIAIQGRPLCEVLIEVKPRTKVKTATPRSFERLVLKLEEGVVDKKGTATLNDVAGK